MFEGPFGQRPGRTKFAEPSSDNELRFTPRQAVTTVRQYKGTTMLITDRTRVLFSFFDGPLDFTAGLAGFDGFPAVVELLAFGEPELHFRVPAFREVDAEGDERQSFLLSLPQQLMNLRLV